MSLSLLKIKTSWTSEIDFYQNFFIYKKEKILCSDVDGIAYLYTRTKNSINFIPVGTSHSYTISIRSKGTTHKISFTGESSQERFNKLVAAVEVIIKPFVIVNLLLDYLKDTKLEIGDLTIKPEGLYKKRTFWRSPEFLPWNGYYNTVISKGHVYVLKKDESTKEYSNFYTPSMSSINAVVLPDIINFLFARNGILDSATRDQIIERKAQLTLVSIQDSIQDIKRCIKCNETVDNSGEICSKCNLATTNPEEIPKQESASVSPTLYCSNCGNKINGDLNFCGNCGTAISK